MNILHLNHIPKIPYNGSGLLNQQFHAEPIIRKGGIVGGRVSSTNLILGLSNRSSAVKSGNQVPQIQSSSILDDLKHAAPILRKGSGIDNKRNNVRIVF